MSYFTGSFLIILFESYRVDFLFFFFFFIQVHAHKTSSKIWKGWKIWFLVSQKRSSGKSTKRILFCDIRKGKWGRSSCHSSKWEISFIKETFSKICQWRNLCESSPHPTFIIVSQVFLTFFFSMWNFTYVYTFAWLLCFKILQSDKLEPRNTIASTSIIQNDSNR